MLRTIMVGFVARFNQSARRQKKPWSIAHWLALGCAAGLLLSIGVQAAYICLGLNWHPVVAGQCYRCGQPSAASLRELVQQHGIRTVINLRGSNPEQEWYQEECRATESVGVVRFDVSLDGFHPPLPRELRKLVDYLEQAELPLLLHCHSGSDRSALASAVFLLLRTDACPAEALKAFDLRYGHLPWGMGACHARLLQRYVEWVRARGLEHAPQHFHQWAHEVYTCKDGR
jgi:protein tyrosine phosphatase (PTP) superfamily phosphohydrolase (DUF442 family)